MLFYNYLAEFYVLLLLFLISIVLLFTAGFTDDYDAQFLTEPSAILLQVMYFDYLLCIYLFYFQGLALT